MFDTNGSEAWAVIVAIASVVFFLAVAYERLAKPVNGEASRLVIGISALVVGVAGLIALLG